MMKLYHTGYEEIRQPDIRHGRKNADFGQGFYMSRSDAFAGKWAREKKGSEIIVNSYELEEEGLSILQLTRDETWYDYLFRNRTGQEDLYPEADVIIGPIANDTIYDTLGIFTSGFLSRELSLQLLKVGPEYEQVVLRTEQSPQADLSSPDPSILRGAPRTLARERDRSAIFLSASCASSRSVYHIGNSTEFPI